MTSAGTLALALILASCSNSTEPALCEAVGVGTITVTGGPDPTFSWAADCSANILAVFEIGTGAGYWELRANAKRIAKPVAYGVVPGGTTETHGALDLRTGTTYGVYVGIVSRTDTLGAVGLFTP